MPETTRHAWPSLPGRLDRGDRRPFLPWLEAAAGVLAAPVPGCLAGCCAPTRRYRAPVRRESWLGPLPVRDPLRPPSAFGVVRAVDLPGCGTVGAHPNPRASSLGSSPPNSRVRPSQALPVCKSPGETAHGRSAGPKRPASSVPACRRIRSWITDHAAQEVTGLGLSCDGDLAPSPPSP